LLLFFAPVLLGDFVFFAGTFFERDVDFLGVELDGAAALSSFRVTIIRFAGGVTVFGASEDGSWTVM